MSMGGYLFDTRGWAIAGPSMIPAGPLITIAFWLAPAPGACRPRPRSHSAARILLLVLGVPITSGNLSLRQSLTVSVLTLIAGALAALAGYALGAHHHLLPLPTLLASGVVIALSFAATAAWTGHSTD